MKEAIKPITYMKTNAADILTQVSESRRPFIITHNGETLALLKVVAMGRQSVEHGRVRPAREALDALNARTNRRRGKK